VASSFSSSCFHSARFSSWVERMRLFRPVECLIWRSSPWRRRLTQRLIASNGRPRTGVKPPRGAARDPQRPGGVT
jgi:hypothetical protein